MCVNNYKSNPLTQSKLSKYPYKAIWIYISLVKFSHLGNCIKNLAVLTEPVLLLLLLLLKLQVITIK